MAYTPTGITAQARQHPMLARTDEDRAALAAAEEKKKRKAERLLAAAEKWPQHGPKVTRHRTAPKENVDRNEERRLKMRARKL